MSDIQELIEKIEDAFSGEELLYGRWQEIKDRYEGTRPDVKVLPVVTNEISKEKAKEWFDLFMREAGIGLRGQYSTNLNGVRLVLVMDWDDMG